MQIACKKEKEKIKFWFIFQICMYNNCRLNIGIKTYIQE